MFHGFSVSVNPIGRWPFLFGAVLAVTALTLWAYSRRLRAGGGRWRYFALTLRLLALLLCLFAALRPTAHFKEKKKQNASIVVLVDTSSSMLIGDEVRGQSRWALGMKAVEQAKDFGKTLGPELDLTMYGFDSKLSEPKTSESLEKTKPSGRETDLGPAILEAQKRQEGTSRRLARLVIVSDFASNNGSDPLEAARRLKGQGVPVVTVGLGTENAGAGHRDIQLRDIITGATGFVKNHHEVRASMKARGFANQTLTVELYVEGQSDAVAKTQVKVPDGADVIPITGIRFIPQTPGEKKITLKVAPQEGELVVTNNEISTVVTVLSGGLNVLFLQGANFTWDYRFLMRAIERSPDIQVEGMVIRRPAQGEKSEVDDAEFTPGRYNVYIFSDLPADYLSVRQHKLLVDAVKKGAGFMMLGGRSSFGAGGWAGTPIEDILPAAIHPGDGELEPPGGVKFVPSMQGFDSYVLQVGANRKETERIWAAMPPILGSNRFGERKGLAQVLATSPAPDAEPLMLSLDIGGRVIAYGGDTWVWARVSEEGRLAHRKLWRQIIFWLSHKENDSENRVKLNLERRRIAVGEKLEFSVTARDSKGATIPNVKYETRVEREGPEPVAEPVEVYDQGEEARGSIYAAEKLGQPGDYSVTTIARRDGQEIGRDKARFLVYQDDRELDNPSADLKLAREIAELTGGEAVTPERLGGYLKAIDRSVYTEYLSSARYEVWDNWPFLLIFTALLTLEWWLRKRNGWV
jgi:Putative glutamine amidotransferase/von Willebrand factor type A domain